MNTGVHFSRIHLAPCGINCGTCMAYLRDRNKCIGCMSPKGEKANHCDACIIRNCDSLNMTVSKFCYDCEKFPCQRLKKLDKRYQNRYKTNLLQNLRTIKETGIEEYLRKESARWSCPGCGSVVCVHRHICKTCGMENRDPEFGKNYIT
jgi:hypothetical protein